MNKKFRNAWIMLALLTSTIACDDDTATPSTSSKVKSTLLDGTWRISYFFDQQDESAHFADYILTFKDDGTVAAVNGPTAVNGMWSISRSDNTTKLVLNFDITEPFDEINDDWDVIQFTEDMIQLKDVSGGSGETDLLTLEKNP